MSAKRDVELVQAESEANPDTPLPEHMRGQRRGRSVVQSVRLPEAEFAEIEQLAGELDVPVSALIRGWVLAGLADERSTSLRSAIERIAGDADRLRRLAANSDVARSRSFGAESADGFVRLVGTQHPRTAGAQARTGRDCGDKHQ